MSALKSSLGKPAEYIDTYTPSLLFSMERAPARKSIGLPDELPFIGEDLWTCYELSWLNDKGKPQVAAVCVNAPCNSSRVLESKSLKLYLNSFAQSRFHSRNDVLRTLNSDLTIAFRAPVIVQLLDPTQLPYIVDPVPGICIDGLDVEATDYDRNPELLALDEGRAGTVFETLHTNLFRSLCPVTGQPDWATIIVTTVGRPLLHSALLRYLISYRSHKAFHEVTVEQIFLDIKQRCAPEQLSVYGRFLRRGGIEINPYRSDSDDQAPLIRVSRQ